MNYIIQYEAKTEKGETAHEGSGGKGSHSGDTGRTLGCAPDAVAPREALRLRHYPRARERLPEGGKAQMKTPRGFGSVYQPTYRDKKTGEVKKQAVFWIQYCRNGQVIRESSESTDDKTAWRLLKRRHGEIAVGKPVGPDVNRTTFEDMAVMVMNDYKANGYSSIKRQEGSIDHLREFFGEYRGIEITSDRVTAYVAFRQEQKAANSTINNELAALSRMFTLAMRAGKAAVKPTSASSKRTIRAKDFSSANNLKRC